MNEKRPAITGMIRAFAASQPDKTALIAGEHSISYKELYRRISSAAAFLRETGVKKGTHVVSMARPDLDYVVCEYAVLGLGAVHIPVENRAPAERIAEIAEAVDAGLVISPEKIPGGFRWLPFSQVDMSRGADLSWEPVCVSDECSEIVFTTGTTGKSKGVMLSSRCLEVYLSAINPSFGLRGDSVMLVTTPLNHVGGLHRVHQCMSVGCTAVLLDGIQNLRAFFEAVRLHGVTHTYLPPASVKMLLTLAKEELARLNGKLEFIYTASAPFPSVDMEDFMKLLPDTRLHQGYGSSETGSVCNCQYNAPDANIKCLGRPYSCVDVKLYDEEGSLIAEPYREGYIRSKSDMNMLGYYKEPELTAAVLKDGYIHSRDLMYFDEEGRLYFAGRGDDVVNIRGFKVAPVEVEEAASRYSKIRECVCVPYEDKSFGLCLKMVVVPREGEALCPEEVADFLAERLEAYKVPRYIETADEIPKTYNGKIDRRRILALQS